jgi:DHA1 family bicyclomycin/chloramphenicol resistance-like MFS transporter
MRSPRQIQTNPDQSAGPACDTDMTGLAQVAEAAAELADDHARAAPAHPPSRPFPMSTTEFIALMASVQALQALAIDSMLPALGVMSRDLHIADANNRQLIVGVFLICAGIGSLVPGTLADRFGRRPIMLGCLAGYLVFTILAALAGSFELLLLARGCMGLCSAGLTVLPPAIIRDRYDGDRMARMTSMVSMVFMVVPMIAPTLGQGVLLLAGWRWIFGIMATMALMVMGWVYWRLPETLRPEFRQPIRFTTLARSMRMIVTTRAAFGYVFGQALMQGALFGYINCSQQLVGEHFGAGTLFPLVFGAMALVMACTNFANSRIVVRFGARRVSQTALLVYIVTSLVQLGMALSGRETLWTFAPLMTLNLCLMGFIGANFASIALQPFAAVAGAAASVQAFIRVALGSAIGIAVGRAYDGTPRPLAMTLLTAGSVALVLVLVSENGRLFRRLHPRVQ